MPYILTRETSNNANVVIVESNVANLYAVSIAIDYTDIYQKIYTSVDRIANTTDRIANTLDTIANSITIIEQNSSNIKNTLISLESHVANLDVRGSTRELGIYTNGIGNTFFTLQQQRAMVVSSLKNADALDNFKAEVENPTPLPGDQ